MDKLFKRDDKKSPRGGAPPVPTLSTPPPSSGSPRGSPRDNNKSPTSSPRLHPFAGLRRLSNAESPRSPREGVALAGAAALRLLDAPVNEETAFRAKYNKFALPLSVRRWAVLWLVEDDSRITVEAIRPKKEKAFASASLSLSRSKPEETLPLKLGTFALSVRILTANDPPDFVHLVSGGTDVALLFNPCNPPVSLLARIARTTLRWPLPVIVDSSCVLCCPKVFSKALRDDIRVVIAADELREVNDREAQLANCALTVATVLYSHGYREQSRGFWLPVHAPSATLVTGFAVAFSTESVTLWGDAPAELVAELESEFTNAPFFTLQASESGYGCPGRLFRFDKHVLGKSQLASALSMMKAHINRRVKAAGTHTPVVPWAANVQVFLETKRLEGPAARGARRDQQRPLRLSLGQEVNDETADPVQVKSLPELAWIISDITGLVSDFEFRYWPDSADVSVATIMSSTRFADTRVAMPKAGRDRKPGHLVCEVHTSRAWKEEAYKGNAGCRLMKQELWLSIVEHLASKGYVFPQVRLNLLAVQFAKVERPVPARLAFLTLILDRDEGAIVEIFALNRAHELAEKLKFAQAVGKIHVRSSHMLFLSVPGSKILVTQSQQRAVNLLDDQFSDERAVEKAVRSAESRCFTVLLKALSDCVNHAFLEPLACGWRNTLQISISQLTLLSNQQVKEVVGPADEPAMSFNAETPVPEFSRLNWVQMPVQGFLLREIAPENRVKTKWIRVTTEGHFSDIHGDFTQKEAEAILEAVPGALKVIAARDEKKSLICWSISYDKSATLPVADRLLCEIRTFEIVNHLVASEWELGPDGADRAEVLLYKHA